MAKRSGLEDEVYLQVMGRLVAEEVFVPDTPVPRSKAPVTVDDVIEVGRGEPKVLELLPALLVKRPAMFVSRRGLNGELAAAVERLKAGRAPESCFGISGTRLLRAMERLERSSQRPAKLKAFRLTAADQELLLELADELELSETDVIRHALRVLAASDAGG